VLEKEIWRATEKDVRDILAEEAPGLTEEEVEAVLERLALYLDVALRQCVAELAKQEIGRREGGDGAPSGPEGAS
jgi:hypothetical protein